MGTSHIKNATLLNVYLNSDLCISLVPGIFLTFKFWSNITNAQVNCSKQEKTRILNPLVHIVQSPCSISCSNLFIKRYYHPSTCIMCYAYKYSIILKELIYYIHVIKHVWTLAELQIVSKCFKIVCHHIFPQSSVRAGLLVWRTW